MPKPLIDLQFPLGGLERRAAFQAQAPFTTPDCQNIRPSDPMRGRMRGGQRPGTVKFDQTQLGSGNRIRLLGGMTLADAVALTFDQRLTGSNWATASWNSIQAPTFDQDGQGIVGDQDDGDEQGLMSSFTDYSASAAYKIGILVVPESGSFEASPDYDTFSIFARANNTTPVPRSSGIEVKLKLQNSGSDTAYLAQLFANGSQVGSDATGTVTGRNANWFDVEVSADTVSAWYAGAQLFNAASVAAHSGQRKFGFSMKYEEGLVL